MARSTVKTNAGEVDKTSYTKAEVETLLKEYVRKDELAKLIMDNKQWFLF